jgi:hypothetical protein
MKDGSEWINGCPYCGKIKWIHSVTCGVKECAEKEIERLKKK